jgi:diguanylate cyclase (GGDEF)-like protein
MQRDLIERSMEIEQAQLRGFARSFAEVEWLLLILVMLYLFVSRPELSRDPLVLGLLSGFAVFILVFRFANPFAKRQQVKITFEIFAMIAFLTGVLGVAGGGPLVNLYLLPIITAALALGKRVTALVVALIAGCYVLVATSRTGSGALTADLVSQAAGVLAPFVLVAFLTTLLAENIRTTKARIRALSDRDELTSLYNMRAFSRLAAREHELAARMETPYSVLMVDVDRLKAINDTYGHEAGNRALQLVADALVRLTRSSDIVARYGGDEFIALLSNCDSDTAAEVAQRIRNVIFSTTLEAGVQIVRVKVSVGAATFPENGNALQGVMTAADRAMYKDKEHREPPKGKLIFQRL